MATGTVKWFSDAKGFGFIEPDEKGADVFAHFSAIQMDGFKTLKQGSRVSYELVDGPKGPHASHIVAAAPAQEQAASLNTVQGADQPSSFAEIANAAAPGEAASLSA